MMSMEHQKTACYRIVAELASRHVTIRGLATRTGIRRETLSRWIYCESRMPIDGLCIIAKELGKPVEFFLTPRKKEQ